MTELFKTDKTNRPAFQFYPSDWLAHTGISSSSLAARGLWIHLLCVMHKSEEYGYLLSGVRPMTTAEIARQVGEMVEVIQELMDELESRKIFQRDESGRIYSRRMVEDYIKAQRNALNGKLGGNPNLIGKSGNEEKPGQSSLFDDPLQVGGLSMGVGLPGNPNITSSSSSSSSSSTSLTPLTPVTKKLGGSSEVEQTGATSSETSRRFVIKKGPRAGILYTLPDAVMKGDLLDCLTIRQFEDLQHVYPEFDVAAQLDLYADWSRRAPNHKRHKNIYRAVKNWLADERSKSDKRVAETANLLDRSEEWPPEFRELWLNYPRQMGLVRAMQAWNSLFQKGVPATEWAAIQEGLQRWRLSQQWRDEHGKYVPNLAKWLDERLWMEFPLPQRSQFTHSPIAAGNERPDGPAKLRLKIIGKQ